MAVVRTSASQVMRSVIISWSVEGKELVSLGYADALAGALIYQTAGNVRITRHLILRQHGLLISLRKASAYELRPEGAALSVSISFAAGACACKAEQYHQLHSGW